MSWVMSLNSWHSTHWFNPWLLDVDSLESTFLTQLLSIAQSSCLATLAHVVFHINLATLVIFRTSWFHGHFRRRLLESKELKCELNQALHFSLIPPVHPMTSCLPKSTSQLSWELKERFWWLTSGGSACAGRAKFMSDINRARGRWGVGPRGPPPGYHMHVLRTHLEHHRGEKYFG